MPIKTTITRQVQRLRAALKPTRLLPVERQLLPNPVVARPDRAGLAMVTMVKDEADFIGEWVSFQMRVGVRHVYVYDNESTDATRDVLASHPDAAHITVIPWHSFHLSAKILAHNHAVATFGPAYRWLGFFDIDEFLFGLSEDDLPKVMEIYDDLPVLSVPWHMFGFGGHDHRPTGLVLENFTQRAKFPPTLETRNILNWKSLIDPTLVKSMKIHEARLAHGRFELMNEDRVSFSPSSKRAPELAVKRHLQLNHYYTRARADFETKISKGRAAKAGQMTNEKRLRTVANTIECSLVEDTAIQRFLPL